MLLAPHPKTGGSERLGLQLEKLLTKWLDGMLTYTCAAGKEFKVILRQKRHLIFRGTCKSLDNNCLNQCTELLLLVCTWITAQPSHIFSKNKTFSLLAFKHSLKVCLTKA